MCVINRLYVFSLITYFFRNKPGTQNDTRMLYIIMNLRGGMNELPKSTQNMEIRCRENLKTSTTLSHEGIIMWTQIFYKPCVDSIRSKLMLFFPAKSVFIHFNDLDFFVFTCNEIFSWIKNRTLSFKYTASLFIKIFISLLFLNITIISL